MQPITTGLEELMRYQLVSDTAKQAVAVAEDEVEEVVAEDVDLPMVEGLGEAEVTTGATQMHDLSQVPMVEPSRSIHLTIFLLRFGL